VAASLLLKFFNRLDIEQAAERGLHSSRLPNEQQLE
jgi:hypothetical protein